MIDAPGTRPHRMNLCETHLILITRHNTDYSFVCAKLVFSPHRSTKQQWIVPDCNCARRGFRETQNGIRLVACSRREATYTHIKNDFFQFCFVCRRKQQKTLFTFFFFFEFNKFIEARLSRWKREKKRIATNPISHSWNDVCQSVIMIHSNCAARQLRYAINKAEDGHRVFNVFNQVPLFHTWW